MRLDAVEQHHEGADEQWGAKDNQLDLRGDPQTEQHTAKKRADEGADARKASRPSRTCAAHLGGVDFRTVGWEDAQQGGTEKEDDPSNQHQKHWLRGDLRQKATKDKH